MKTHTTLLIVIAVLAVVVAGGYVYKERNIVPAQTATETPILMRTYSGEIHRIFEGDNKLSYSFDIPEDATTTLGMDGSLLRITNGTSSYASIYISYEGGRGYTPMDYINYVIAPKVSTLTLTGTSTIGDYEWQGAESFASEWHVASLLNGNWLFIVENKKAVHDTVNTTLESLFVGQ